MKMALDYACLIRHEHSSFSGELLDKIREHNERLIYCVMTDAIAACRAAVEKQLIRGALSLQGKTAVEQADAVLAAINAVEVR